MRASAGEVVVLMNNDVACIDPGWSRARWRRPDCGPRVGIAGALLLYEDGAVQHAGVVVGPGAQGGASVERAPGVRRPPAGPRRRHRRLRGRSGVRCSIRLGGLEEALPVTWNDVDFCLRLREAGLRVLLAREAVLVHAESATRSADSAP